jgi:hypothetical protein
METFENRVGATGAVASSIRSSSFGCALCAIAVAQAPQPFAPPQLSPYDSVSPDIAALDANRDGQVDVLSPGLFFGSLLVSIDEHGRTLASSPVTAGFVANPRHTVSPAPIAVHGGDLDGDGREDLIFVTSEGSVHVQRNLGARRLAAIDFAPPQTISYVGGLLPNSPPFSRITVATIVVDDFDGNGEADIAVGFGVHDGWNAVARPGLVACYLADGAGAYVSRVLPLTGSVCDLEWADLDGDGQRDHFVVVAEDGGNGAYFHHLHHLCVQNGALVPVGAAVALGTARPVALEVGDVDLDGMPDYVLAMLQTVAGQVDASVVMYPGDGAGNPNVAMSSTLPLPPAAGIGSFVPSLQVDDFNGDGVLDIATLRGTLTTYPSTSTPSEVGEAELIVHMGPTPFLASPQTVPLATKVYFGDTTTTLSAVRPVWTEPDMLCTFDLGGDGNADLMIAGARTLAQPNSVTRVTLRNGSPPRLGLPARVKVGEPSGGDPTRPARIGFDGVPRLGNAGFRCTIQNVRTNCLCGLMWGPLAQQNVASVYGFDLHVLPQHLGQPLIATGAPGAGFASYQLPIPNTAALVGDAGCFQFNYYDPAIDAFGASQGTGLWIGS